VQGWASKNKLVLGAGAAGVVVVLALLTKGRGASSPAPTGTTVSGTTAGQNVGAYDSSASDVYNAIQPEVAALRDLIENWQATQVPVPGGATSDVSTPPATTTPTPTTVPLPNLPPSPPPADVALSPVGTALWNEGITPPADRGATNSQQQADYGKAYEAAWNAKYGLK
jgi:hypothetical protein